MPSTVSIVVLPDPDGPTTATWSPVAICDADAAQRVDTAGVLLAHVAQAQRDTVPAPRSSLGVGHLQAGVMPAPEIWT